MSNDIPYGYCHCGCGQKTNLAKSNNPKYGWVKGQPVNYIHNHHTKHPFTPKVNPTGLCQCGCGQKAPIATKTDALRGVIKGQPRLYISGHNGYRNKPEDVWKQVAIGDRDECWLWQGIVNNKNYGYMSVNNKSTLVHRLAYKVTYGEIPDGLWVLHKCDNPRCCNPNHLFLGTSQDNVDDMISKGRQRHRGLRGDASWRSKLTKEQVGFIKDQLKKGISTTELAKQFNVSYCAIWYIKIGRTWNIPL